MIPIKSQIFFKHGTRGRKVRENDNKRSLGVLDYGKDSTAIVVFENEQRESG